MPPGPRLRTRGVAWAALVLTVLAAFLGAGAAQAQLGVRPGEAPLGTPPLAPPEDASGVAPRAFLPPREAPPSDALFITVNAIEIVGSTVFDEQDAT